MKLNRLYVFLFLLGCNPVVAVFPPKEPVNEKCIYDHQSSYKNYLDNVAWGVCSTKMSPWWTLYYAAGLQGYPKDEADAIPAGYPFFCGANRENLFKELVFPEAISDINRLLKDLSGLENITAKSAAGKKRAEEREMHLVFHKYTCEKLQLNSATTTRQLSDSVLEGTISENQKNELLKVYIKIFFVKYLWDKDWKERNV